MIGAITLDSNVSMINASSSDQFSSQNKNGNHSQKFEAKIQVSDGIKIIRLEKINQNPTTPLPSLLHKTDSVEISNEARQRYQNVYGSKVLSY